MKYRCLRKGLTGNGASYCNQYLRKKEGMPAWEFPARRL
jgi:hypothetical protein